MYCSLKLEALAVRITIGSRVVPGSYGLWRDDNDGDNNNNNAGFALGKINDIITTNSRQVVYVNYNAQYAQKFILDKLEEILIPY
jgi:hypothetical protein